MGARAIQVANSTHRLRLVWLGALFLSVSAAESHQDPDSTGAFDTAKAGSATAPLVI
jgi:hypothetical protein